MTPFDWASLSLADACTRRRSVRPDSAVWTNDRKWGAVARLWRPRACVSSAERTSNSLSRISMSGIPGCSVARNTNLTGCSPKRWRSCPTSGDSWPTHSSTTTRSMRFMSGHADHPGVGSVGPSHHAGRHTPSMFSPLPYCVFGILYRPSPDDLPTRLRLEYCWLLCERIDAAPLLCGGLLYGNEFSVAVRKKRYRF